MWYISIEKEWQNWKGKGNKVNEWKECDVKWNKSKCEESKLEGILTNKLWIIKHPIINYTKWPLSYHQCSCFFDVTLQPLPSPFLSPSQHFQSH